MGLRGPQINIQQARSSWLPRVFFSTIKKDGLLEWERGCEPIDFQRNQMLRRFTPERLIEAFEQGRYESCIHEYLNSVGGNPALSAGLRLQKRYWSKPQQLALENLQCSSGPERHLEFYQSPEGWKAKIASMRADIVKGWQPPPLICECKKGGILSIRDGSHRVEALKAAGYKLYWAAIWFNTWEDYTTYHQRS